MLFKKAVRIAIPSWHSWFAWHPVSISDTEIVWLETIERRMTTSINGYVQSWSWKYRLHL